MSIHIHGVIPWFSFVVLYEYPEACASLDGSSIPVLVRIQFCSRERDVDWLTDRFRDALRDVYTGVPPPVSHYDGPRNRVPAKTPGGSGTENSNPFAFFVALAFAAAGISMLVAALSATVLRHCGMKRFRRQK